MKLSFYQINKNDVLIAGKQSEQNWFTIGAPYMQLSAMQGASQYKPATKHDRANPVEIKTDTS